MGAVVANARQIEEVVLVLIHAANVFVPVRAGFRLGRRHDGLLLAFIQSLFVVVFPGVTVVVHRRQGAGLKRSVFPAATDTIPLAWIAEAGTSLDIVPVHVAGAVAVGPEFLAGD